MAPKKSTRKIKKRSAVSKKKTPRARKRPRVATSRKRGAASRRLDVGSLKRTPRTPTFMASVAKGGADVAEPECLDMSDAIRIVRECLKEITGNPSMGNVDMGVRIADLLPAPVEVRRFLDCIKKKTGFELDPGDFGDDATLQSVADKLACAE